jgi:hypothetical protein
LIVTNWRAVYLAKVPAPLHACVAGAGLIIRVFDKPENRIDWLFLINGTCFNEKTIILILPRLKSIGLFLRRDEAKPVERLKLSYCIHNPLRGF